MVAGRYVFTLMVSDAQGATDSDTVSVFVNPDPLLMNLVELTLNMEANMLNQAELESLKQKLMLLLGDHVQLNIRDIRYEQKTGHIIIIFYVDRVVSSIFIKKIETSMINLRFKMEKLKRCQPLKLSRF